MLAKNYLNLKKIKLIPTRNGYGEGLVEAGQADKNVVVLCADLTESTRSLAFQQKFPARFIEAGVAEMNMMGMAAGLAVAGKIPFVSSYAVFSPGRNWDILRVAVCYNQANVKVVGAHAGVSVGPDGATHQALEDLAITRVLPNMTVVVPCDFHEIKKATMALAKHRGPCYMRFAREKTPVFTVEKTPFKIGRAETFRPGSDVTVVACGPLVYEALVAAAELKKEGIDVRVINNHTIKPLDKRTLISAAKETGAIVTVEEHQINGGLGGAVAELLAKNYPTPMEMIAMPDTFGESGEPSELLEKYRLTAPAIKQAILKVIKRKKS